MLDARTLSRKALALLEALGCDPTPQAYAVAFAHAADPEGKVAGAVTASVTRHGRLRAAEVARIHDSHLDGARSAFADTAGSFDQRLGEALDMVGESVARTGEAAERLAAANSIEQAGEVLSQAALDQGDLARRLKEKSDELDAMRRRYQETLEETRRDPLTGLANRRAYDQGIADAVAEAGPGRPLSLLVADIDHFKAVNDGYGHAVGDEVIRLVGKTIRGAVRATDLVARIGGEEFAILLPNADRADAMAVGERIRSTIERYRRLAPMAGELLGRKVTISVGVVEAEPGEGSASLYARADACLYAAKRGGRNRVVDRLSPDDGGQGAQPRD